jgi:hypothetical protein
VLSSTPLSLLLVVFGSTCVLIATRTYIRAVGILALAIGGMGNQLCVMAGVVLAFAWLIGRGLTELNHEKTPVGRLLIVALLPASVSVACIVLMRFGMGIEDFGSRTIELESGILSFAHAKFYVLSNAYANLYQPVLEVLAGRPIALGAFWHMAAGVPAAIFVASLLRPGFLISHSALLSVAVPGTFLLAMSPLLGTAATPTGFRLLGPVILLLVFAFSMAATHILYSRGLRLGGLVLLAIVSCACFVSSLRDVQVRADALLRDSAWARLLEEEIKSRSLNSVVLCSKRFKDPRTAQEGILESYRARTVDSYSVWYTQFLPAYLSLKRVSLIEESVAALGESSSQKADRVQLAGNEGPWVQSMSSESALFVCGPS